MKWFRKKLREKNHYNRDGLAENRKGGTTRGCHARAEPQSFAEYPPEVRRVPNFPV